MYQNLTYKTLTKEKMLNSRVLFSTATKDKQAQDTNTYTTFCSAYLFLQNVRPETAQQSNLTVTTQNTDIF